MPNSNEVIVEHEGILYVANILDEEIKPLLKDQMDDYSLKDAIEQSLQLRDDGNDPFVWWGSRASVNPSGTIMAFFTNRSGESEIWMKNLTNGEEEKLLNSHMKVKKWINDVEFIASESHDVFRFNILTRKKDYFGKSSTFDVSDRYVVLQEKDGLLDFHNLDNNEHKQYESPGFNYVRAIATLENSAWIAVLNQLKRESIHAELYLINTEDFTTKVLEIPDPFIALVIEWKSKDELYLVAEDRVTQIQETKIINTNDL